MRLLNFAKKIKARAIEQIGEILRSIPPAQGANQNIGGDAPTKVGRLAVAERAGLSKDQAVTALRVANIPKEERDRLIESDAPPTVTALAELGTKKKPLLDLGSRSPEEFHQAGLLIGAFEQFQRDIQRVDLDQALHGLDNREREALVSSISAACNWIGILQGKMSDGLQSK